MRRRLLSLASVLVLTPVISFAEVSVFGGLEAGASASLTKWAPMTVSMDSAPLVFTERDIAPNPFLDYRYNVLFTGPSGQQYTVPGFFAGDGFGVGQGSIWKAHFSPDETGEWSYRVSFRTGNNLAVSLAHYAGTPTGDDGKKGTFTVDDTQSGANDFLSFGRLEYDGSHYLKFADGPYFIKGGVDSPENFFGFAGFDNTVDHKGGAGSAGLIGGIHRYPSHVEDWVEGDPDFSNVDTGESGRAIIGAINYLSKERVNSIYFLPMNLGGDGRETFPFVGSSGSEFDNTHYDISKLHQWALVLEHMQQRDILAHIVLNEQEPINTAWFDDGELGIERKLYYRELVARFGFLLALKWNISEESRYGAERHTEFASYLRALDWAQHPVAVHTRRDRPEDAYDELLGNTLFDITSIQYSPENGDDFVEYWRKQSAASGWPWVIDMDEIGSPQVGLTDTNTDTLRKLVLYPVYFSGGNLEWYFGYHNLPLGGDIRTEDFRTREAMYRAMWIARDFMQQHLPFWKMTPDDSLHTLPAQSPDDTAVIAAEEDQSLLSESDEPVSDVQVFFLDGDVYAVYLPMGNVGGAVSVLPGTYSLQWFDPRAGTFVGDSVLIASASDAERTDIEVPVPPDAPLEDWVLLIKTVTSPVTNNIDSPSANSETSNSPVDSPEVDNPGVDNPGVDSPDIADANNPDALTEESTETPELSPENNAVTADSEGDALVPEEPPALGSARAGNEAQLGAMSLALMLSLWGVLSVGAIERVRQKQRRQRRFTGDYVCGA